MRSSDQLREQFLSFFEAQGHTRCPSDGLVPSGDPTVLFTSAGMNQFKPYFLALKSDLRRAASCQKCLRTGDLERVGKSASHHSFFEMLGNFSFGDYFKQEAIGWAWEFLTGTTDYAGTRSRHADRCLSLPKDKLWVSIYEKDEEAFELWRKLGVPEARIRRFGQAENFWPANAPKDGPNGPCGPCSEIYFDADGAVEGPTSVEIWNLVFTQFDRQSDGSLKPLARPSIDTGMGLERLARVIQKVDTDYDTDLFKAIVDAIKSRQRKQAPDAAVRTLADHMRAVVFLIAEGIMPSNEARGYVARMLIRRSYRFATTILDLRPHDEGEKERLWPVANAVLVAMRGSPYAVELNQRIAAIQDVIGREQEQFAQTLAAGNERLQEVLNTCEASRKRAVPGEEAFRLYDTHGLPLEITVDAAAERGLTVDREGFERALQAQQQRSREGSQFKGEVFAGSAMKVREALRDLPPHDAQFIGYETLQGEAKIQGLWDGHQWVDAACEGQAVGIVLDRSPFYGESGGQVGDSGRIEGLRGLAEVSKTAWVDEVLVHHATVRQGALKVQEPVRALVDAQRRLQIARSHTGTHLLHWALRKVLGPEAAQAGSLVDAERLRFDVCARSALRDEQLREVEALVNSRVRLADAVQTDKMKLEEAKRAGALAMFGEKYGQTVRVVSIGDYSKELCGGTHLLHTGLLGAFTIVSESSIAAGTRRLEALVGQAASQRHLQERQILQEVARKLGRGVDDIAKGLEELLEQLTQAEQERRARQADLARVEARRLVGEGKQIHGVTYVAATLQHMDRDALAAVADALRQAFAQPPPRDAVVVLACANHGSVALVMATTAGVSKRVHAGQMLKAISAITQGSGGGRPDFAQAAGKDPSRLPEALKRAEELVREALQP
ncbi:MAG: alanine--tRNA ligase [Candidatus Omnitrophica bacterium]|nr:alanine--tRNA ligase [Candidatus Omnitrophota bacterium]